MHKVIKNVYEFALKSNDDNIVRAVNKFMDSVPTKHIGIYDKMRNFIGWKMGYTGIATQLTSLDWLSHVSR